MCTNLIGTHKTEEILIDYNRPALAIMVIFPSCKHRARSRARARMAAGELLSRVTGPWMIAV